MCYRRIRSIGAHLASFAIVALAGFTAQLFGQLQTDDRSFGNDRQRPEWRGFPAGPPPMQEDRAVLEQFDKDGNGWLGKEERSEAREFLKSQPSRGFLGPPGPRGEFRGPPGAWPPGPFGGPGRPPRRRGPMGSIEPGRSGPNVRMGDAIQYQNEDLYAPGVLRTLFLEFEEDDWESELSDFIHTDVDVPATLQVDGRTYPGVGVRFRGMSSLMMIPTGSKRSLNLSLDLVDKKQRLLGYKTLNLLNSHGDPGMMSTFLYSHIARKYIPAPKANFVKVVVNGEYWGVYVNVQQFNKDFLLEHYPSSKGARWKVTGSPQADGGLVYLGEDIAEYKRRFEIKSDDDEQSWRDLIQLCKILCETPVEKLEEMLVSVLDVGEVLKFLALDVVLVNSDGYWTRASDYSIFQDRSGVFHVLPHDMNEAFHDRPAGPRRRIPPAAFRFGPPHPGGVNLDPLVGLDDHRKPLRSKLLSVPAWRQRYLQIVYSIAHEDLASENIHPVIEDAHALILDAVRTDTRKLASFEEFERQFGPPGPDGDHGGLRSFLQRRREYLLQIQEVQAAAAQ